MKKFIVDLEFSGYSRGTVSYEVEAETAEEAEDNWWTGKEICRDIIRDDTEKEVIDVEEADDSNKENS